MNDSELLDWIDANNITIDASSQRGYKSWQIVHLAGSTDGWLLAQTHAPLREALEKAKRRFDASAGVRPAPIE